jgi:PRTRC genetic system protein A
MPCLFPVYQEPPDGTLQPGNIAQYNICENGIFLTKSMCGGAITVKVDGLPGCGTGREIVKILKRKMPMSIFWQTVDFFKHVEDHFKEDGLEAYILVGYDPKENKFFLSVPPQKVGCASVEYDISTFRAEHPGCYIVMDIHSHTSRMGAFFSGTDDNDDNRDRFSMVLGMISKIIPEYKVRFSTMSRRQDYDLEDIFEDSDEAVEMESVETAMNKILYTKVSYVYSGKGAAYAYGYNGFDWEDYYSSGDYKTAKHEGNSWQNGVKNKCSEKNEKTNVIPLRADAPSAKDEEQEIYAAIASKLQNADGMFLISGL